MTAKTIGNGHPFLFMRHGQTDWNAEKRFQGQTDIPLNETGRGQARDNGARLASVIDGIADWPCVVSPMSRTRETAEIAREAMGLPRKGYQTDDRLIEVSFGRWERYTLDELEQTLPDEVASRGRDKWNFVPPGGESYADLTARVQPVFEALNGPTLIVAHGGVMRALFVLTGALDPADAAMADVPQDRVLRVEGTDLSWI